MRVSTYFLIAFLAAFLAAPVKPVSVYLLTCAGASACAVILGTRFGDWQNRQAKKGRSS